MAPCPWCGTDLGYLNGKLFCPNCGVVEPDTGEAEFLAEEEKKMKKGGGYIG